MGGNLRLPYTPPQRILTRSLYLMWHKQQTNKTIDRITVGDKKQKLEKLQSDNRLRYVHNFYVIRNFNIYQCDLYLLKNKLNNSY